jgi:outer membrane protein assembly factor BamB
MTASVAIHRPASLRCRPFSATSAASVIAASVLVTFLPGDRATARDWPTFRGEARTGVAPDTNLLETWPAEGPKLVWQAAGAGRGYASPAIAGNRKQLWKTKTGTAWTDGQPSWQSSRSTPTVDGQTVYVLSPFGQLVACRVADGGELFRVDLKETLGGKKTRRPARCSGRARCRATAARGMPRS